MNPILAGNQAWKCPGHGSIVQDQSGRYWLLYHAYSTGGSIFTGREGMLDEVKFGADGWPTINDGTGPSAQNASPFGTTQRTTGSNFIDDFSVAQLRPGWQWPADHEPAYRLEHGHLLLSADGRTNLLTAVLARPTTAADYIATTIIETKSLKSGSFAGLCAYGDSHNAMGIAVSDNGVIAWRQEDGVSHPLGPPQKIDGDRTHVRLLARHGYRLQLSASSDGRTWQNVGETLDAQHLPPWDRSVRVALTVGGATNAVGQFDSFAIEPLKAP
jgi:beta-xylosidase